MIAAINNNKEALLQLLAPFITSEDVTKLYQLLHHTNARGQRLLGLVVHHRHNLLVAHGLLVEFEALAHGWNSRKVKACFRDTLGSTAGAADTLHMFKASSAMPKPISVYDMLQQQQQQQQTPLSCKHITSMCRVFDQILAGQLSSKDR